VSLALLGGRLFGALCHKNSMDQIIANIQDPSWWFTGIFFVLCALLVNKFANYLPKFSVKRKRARRLKILKVIKNNRQHDLKIQWLIGRYWAMATLSVGYLIFSCFVFLFIPGVSGNIKNLALPLIMFLLAYTSIFFVVREQEILRELLEENIKWKKLHNNRFNRTGFVAGASKPAG
jgi:MFS family permease